MFLCRIHGLIKDAPDSLCQKSGGAIQVFFVDSLLGAGKNITHDRTFPTNPICPACCVRPCFNGFVPGYVVSLLSKKLGILRASEPIQEAGMDIEINVVAYPEKIKS